MSGVLQGLMEGVEASNLAQLRRTAEIETGNAEAAFQRLLAEPRKHRGRKGPAFAMVTYLQRLERHLIALAEQIGTVAPPHSDLATLAGLLGGAQDEIAAAIDTDQGLGSCPSFDEVLARLRAGLTAGEGQEHGAEVAFLLGRVVSDTRNLHTATAQGVEGLDLREVI